MRNDSRRLDKQTKRLVDLDNVPARVLVPWKFAVDLGFATVTYPDSSKYSHPTNTVPSIVGKPVYTAVEHPNIAAVADGVIVDRIALKLALNAAPRGVRRRIRGFAVKTRD